MCHLVMALDISCGRCSCRAVIERLHRIRRTFSVLSPEQFQVYVCQCTLVKVKGAVLHWSIAHLPIIGLQPVSG